MKTASVLPVLALLLWTPDPCLAAANGGTTITSSFEVDEEGWTHTGAAVFQQESFGGNPMGKLLIDNSEGPVTYIYAPATFLGSLISFEGGAVSFEGNMLGIGGSPWVDPRDYGHLRIMGPSLSAEIDLVPSQPQNGVWNRYSASLDAATWGLSPANWATLLSNVTEIRLSVEAMFGNEVQGIDNFTLSSEPPLVLTIDPRFVAAGDTLVFEVQPGKPLTPAITAAVVINGMPTFVKVAIGLFDANGLWSSSAVVPTGLTGVEVTFVSFGRDPCGRAKPTNHVAVVFL